MLIVKNHENVSTRPVEKSPKCTVKMLGAVSRLSSRGQKTQRRRCGGWIAEPGRCCGTVCLEVHHPFKCPKASSGSTTHIIFNTPFPIVYFEIDIHASFPKNSTKHEKEHFLFCQIKLIVAWAANQTGC